ncbi:MAG: hypothetical protein CMJ52_08290 [Planctomycetaceae bacterium]|nr:hypothetical protein [Planctomycetaceae bacterium]
MSKRRSSSDASELAVAPAELPVAPPLAPVDPVDPDTPVDPVDPDTPVDPVDPVEPVILVAPPVDEDPRTPVGLVATCCASSPAPDAAIPNMASTAAIDCLDTSFICAINVSVVFLTAALAIFVCRSMCGLWYSEMFFITCTGLRSIIVLFKGGTTTPKSRFEVTGLTLFGCFSSNCSSDISIDVRPQSTGVIDTFCFCNLSNISTDSESTRATSPASFSSAF